MAARRPIASIGQVTGLQDALDAKQDAVVALTPVAPTDFAVTTVASGAVSFSWTASSEAAYYEIESSRDSGFQGGIRSSLFPGVTGTISGLEDAKHYWHRIRSVAHDESVSDWATALRSGYGIVCPVATGTGGYRDWRLWTIDKLTWADARNGVGAVVGAINETALWISSYFTGGKYYVYRSALEFDTSEIPSTATVVSGTRIKMSRTGGATMTLGALEGSWANAATPAWDDFTGSEIVTRATPDVGAFSLTLTTFDAVEVGTNARTKIMLRAAKDIDNTAPLAVESIIAASYDNATSSLRPSLAVAYKGTV